MKEDKENKARAIWMIDKRVLSLTKAAASDAGISTAEYTEMVLRQHLAKLPPIKFSEVLKEDQVIKK